MSNPPEIAKANLSESTMISDLDLSILIDQLVIDYKAAGKSREWIERNLHLEVERAIEEQFDDNN